jgi:hypothetical protein
MTCFLIESGRLRFDKNSAEMHSLCHFVGSFFDRFERGEPIDYSKCQEFCPIA